jgi:Metallopeptidase family M24
MPTEDKRAGRLLNAQANAVALLDEVAARGIIAAGQGEQAVSDWIRDLANEMFGKTRHWHKRIVRSGPHTLSPYRENPPDRIIEADDIVFADFGPIFEEFEAGLGRT